MPRDWGESPETERRRRGRTDLSMREDEVLDEEGEEPRKAPLLLRLVAWISLAALFGAIGYAAPDWIFRLMNRGGEPDVVANGPEAERALAPNPASSDESRGTCVLYVPGASDLEPRDFTYRKGLREEEIGQSVEEFLAASKESRWIDGRAGLLNLFRSGDWLYINLNGAFLDSLRTLGRQKAPVLLTGLVRSVAEGFPPIQKIKFYIDGREIQGKDPVDLSKPWSLSRKSS